MTTKQVLRICAALTLVASTALTTTACARRSVDNAVEFKAELKPTRGFAARGIVRFRKQSDHVLVTAELRGLEPGKHGFHIHEFGACNWDASSAGGHFNPAGAAHGGPAAGTGARHAGDLGNVEAGADGTAHYERKDTVLAMTGENTILRRAVIIHEGSDDLMTQPTGGAGARVACGVIDFERGDPARR